MAAIAKVVRNKQDRRLQFSPHAEQPALHIAAGQRVERSRTAHRAGSHPTFKEEGPQQRPPAGASAGEAAGKALANDFQPKHGQHLPGTFAGQHRAACGRISGKRDVIQHRPPGEQ